MSLWTVNRDSENYPGELLPVFEEFDREAANARLLNDPLMRPPRLPFEASPTDVRRWRATVEAYRLLLDELYAKKPIQPTVAWE